MLLRRDVAEHRRAVPAGQGRADAAGDVVVAGGDVGHERAEHVERRLVADFDLLLDVHLDLVHRDVAGAFDHHLRAACLPAAVSSPSTSSSANWAASLASAIEPGRRPSPRLQVTSYCAHDVAQVVEVRVERILLAVGHHPLGDQRAAAADDAGDAVHRQVQVLEQDAAVDRHVVDALLGLVLDHVEKVLRRHVVDVAAELFEHLVDRHGADRHGRGVDDRLADGVDVAAGGEVHHRVGAEVDGRVQLFQLAVEVCW